MTMSRNTGGNTGVHGFVVATSLLVVIAVTILSPQCHGFSSSIAVEEKKQRLVALQKASEFGLDDDAHLYALIRGMLGTLNDPYTVHGF